MNAPSVVVKAEMPSAVFVSGLSPVPVGMASAKLGWASASRSFTERLSGDASPEGPGPASARATIPGRAMPWMTPVDRGRCGPGAEAPPAGGTGSCRGTGAVPGPRVPWRAGAWEAGTVRCPCSDSCSDGGTAGTERGSRFGPCSEGGTTGTERGSRPGVRGAGEDGTARCPRWGAGAMGTTRRWRSDGGSAGTARFPLPGSTTRSGARSDEGGDCGDPERREGEGERLDGLGGATGMARGSRPASGSRSEGGTAGTERGSRFGPCSEGGTTGMARGSCPGVRGAGEGGTARCPRLGDGAMGTTRRWRSDGGSAGTARFPLPGSTTRSGARSDEGGDCGDPERREGEGERLGGLGGLTGSRSATGSPAGVGGSGTVPGSPAERGSIGAEGSSFRVLGGVNASGLRFGRGGGASGVIYRPMRVVVKRRWVRDGVGPRCPW